MKKLLGLAFGSVCAIIYIAGWALLTLFVFLILIAGITDLLDWLGWIDFNPRAS